MTKKIRVAVVFGGRSEEHEVSCISARHVVAAMDPERYEIVPIGITREGRFLLPDTSKKVLEGGSLEIPVQSFKAEGDPVGILQDPSRKELVTTSDGQYAAAGTIDVVFPVLHGPYGEDGTIQGMLELADIPYVGSGVLGSALGMDKEKMKILLTAAGLPCVRYKTIRDYEWEENRELLLVSAQREFEFPVFTKPANLGSSVGISKCRNAEELIAGIKAAFEHDRKILVEEGIAGRELEVGVLGNDKPEASAIGEILPSREFYDYEAKYIDESSRTVIPADIPAEVAAMARDFALRSFKAIDAQGMARVDFFYTEDERGLIVNEINTIPGFTTISMYPKLWEESGITYAALIDRLIELAIERHAKKRRPEQNPARAIE